MPESRSGPLSTPLVQFGLGALALVVGAAVLFALVGLVSEDDPVATPAVDETPATTAATTAPTEPATTAPATDATTGPATDPATDSPTTAAPTDEATSEAPQIDPASVTIQVLDGVGDSEQQNDAVLGCLRDAGYSSLITNDAAVAYEVTEVFYTPGEDNEGAARQVAAAIGRSQVEEKPDNLSDSVPVHIVVGRDATDPC